MLKRLALGCAAIGALAGAAAAQPIYTGPGLYHDVGRITYGPGGSSQQRIGGATYLHGPGGDRTYYSVGHSTYGSDGSRYDRVGNTIYGPGNSSATTIGDATYVHRSDGSVMTCLRKGALTYCN